MDRLRFPKSYRVLLPLLVVAVILTLIMPRRGEFKYKYRKGTVWNYETLVAPFSFPILKTSDQLTAEMLSDSDPLVLQFKYSSEPGDEAALALSSTDMSVRKVLEGPLERIYAAGILPDTFDETVNEYDATADEICVLDGKLAQSVPTAELYTLRQSRLVLQRALLSSFPGVNVDSLWSAQQLSGLVSPNLSLDINATNLQLEKSIREISPTMGTFQAGDIIISAGETVTAEKARILDSFKSEYQGSLGSAVPSYLQWLGHFILSVLLSLMLLCAIWFSNSSLMYSMNEYLFILNIFLISCIATFVVGKISPEYLMLVPYPVIALYYMAFLDRRVVLPLYTVSLIPLLLFSLNGATLFLVFLLGGIVGIYSFSNLYKGWRQFASALFAFLVMAAGYVALTLTAGEGLDGAYRVIMRLFFASLFIVLAYPMNFLFEKIFNLVSLSRLEELSDTNNRLLRDLSSKAPGTFQHSLSVMNMCEAAARSIDADEALVRVGALYHDIGKMMNPQCFTENQVPGENYHALLSPKESAAEIIRHTTDGLAMAERSNLPSAVRDFITTHHGTSCTGYFYTQYLNGGGDPADEWAFRYPGPAPRTKEQAILMLCDSLEAASRSLKSYTAESVGELVDSITNQKLGEGQFNESNITFGEIRTVSDTMKNYIMQMHHSRIAYPKRKNNNTK